MNKIKHSKFKNTGILFELLVRQITADILNNVEESNANKILSRYFNESTDLGKELKLYQLLINEKSKDTVNADRIVEMIVNSRRKLSSRNLSQQKFELIKEIKDNYPINDFLKGKLSNYKLLASIYKLFESVTRTEYTDPVEMMSSRDCIMESLTDKVRPTNDDADKMLEFYKKQEKDLQLLSYKILVDKFNDKYSGLNEHQQGILKEYINNISNTNSLKSYINKEVDVIVEQLNVIVSDVNDSVVKIKINETVNQLSHVKSGTVAKDNHIMALLLSHELLKELKATKTDG